MFGTDMESGLSSLTFKKQAQSSSSTCALILYHFKGDSLKKESFILLKRE
jgi:hypothetical protein